MITRRKFSSESINEFYERTKTSCDELNKSFEDFRRKQSILFQKFIEVEQEKVKRQEIALNEGKTEKELKKEGKKYQKINFDPSRYDIDNSVNPEIISELKQKFEQFKSQIYEHLQWIEHNSKLTKYLK